ncbi:MAG: hypothetical protein AVDCRST_MAG68-1341, partial [uncultured Gemmatimonadetes bacterium]
ERASATLLRTRDLRAHHPHRGGGARSSRPGGLSLPAAWDGQQRLSALGRRHAVELHRAQARRGTRSL